MTLTDRLTRASTTSEAGATSAADAAFDVFLDCFHQGVLVRAAGENLVLAPPFVVEQGHIDQMVSTLAASIRKHA